jgi:hypothetical protein
MDKKRIAAIAGGTLVALAAIGGGIGLATGGDDDRPLKGDVLDRASEAALAHVGEGTVVETEAGDDGAAYEVEVKRDDGTVVEVQLDSGFDAIGSERDDDGTDGPEDDGSGDD